MAHETQTAVTAHEQPMAEVTATMASIRDEVADVEADRVAMISSEARQRFESAIDFAIVVADTDGTIVACILGAPRVTGWTADEVVGRFLELILTPAARAFGRAPEEMRQAFREGRVDRRAMAPAEGWSAVLGLRQDDATPRRRRALRPAKVLSDRTNEHLAGRNLEEAGRQLRRAQEEAVSVCSPSISPLTSCTPRLRSAAFTNCQSGTLIRPRQTPLGSMASRAAGSLPTGRNSIPWRSR